MRLPSEFYNLIAYVIQLGLLVLIGAFLAKIFRIRIPHVLLVCWQLLLVFSILIPLLTPRQVRSFPTTMFAVESEHVEAATSIGLMQLPSLPPTNWSTLSWHICICIFIAGFAARVAWLTMGIARLKQLRKNARSLETLPPGIGNAAYLSQRAAEILISTEIPGPATFGFPRSSILLPERYQQMEPGSQVSILCHELIHVRRRDWLFALGEQLILALLWFHPAIWWLVRRIDLTREQLVDREVMALSVDCRLYLKSLLASIGGRAELLSANLFLTRHHLKQRVALLLEEVTMSRKRLIISLSCIAFLFCASAVVAAHAFPLTGFVVADTVIPSAPHPSASTAPTTPPASPRQEVVPVAPTRRETSDKAPAVECGVAGVVVDEDNIPLAGVAITMADAATSDVIITGFTDARGVFELVVPFQGKADFRFSREGFKSAIIKGINLIAHTPYTFKVNLKLEGPQEVISINGDGVMSFREGQIPTGSETVPAASVPIPSRVIQRVDPAYPASAKAQGIKATVLLEISIGIDGEVSEARIIKGHPLFDETVKNAVRQWHYSPAVLNGSPHAVSGSVAFIFQLSSRPE